MIYTLCTSSAGTGPNYNIPQLNMSSSIYKKIVGNIGPSAGPDQPFDEDERMIQIYDDGFIEIRDDFILLEIDEHNTTFQKENFEIELFEVQEEFSWRSALNNKGKKFNKSELLVPLKFEGPPVHNSSEQIQYVDYFFDIDVDLDINEFTLCKYKGVNTVKGLFAQDLFNCEEGPDHHETGNQYRTFVEDIGEVCEDV